MGFSGKISSSFLRQSAVVQIVLVNAVVFVIVHIAALFGIGYAGEWLMLPQSWTEVMSMPWTLLTYMFAHFDFLHILGNMLCLYCFGIVALDLMTPQRFVSTYIAGGFAGAAAYLFAAEFVPSPGLIGSSAAVMAVAAAAVLTKPDYHVRLWLFGLVKIKWIALFYVAFALLATRADASAVCAHAAHLGGIMAGRSWLSTAAKNILPTAQGDRAAAAAHKACRRFRRKPARHSARQGEGVGLCVAVGG